MELKHNVLGKKACFSQFLFSLILWETNHFIAMVTINTEYLWDGYVKHWEGDTQKFSHIVLSQILNFLYVCILRIIWNSKKAYFLKCTLDSVY